MNDTYSLQFEDNALNDLKHIDKAQAARILKKIRWLTENAEQLGHHALTGQWSGYYRLRIGTYRVIYHLDKGKRLIIVERLGHRRDVYDE